jgi:hypothetical protein
MMHPYRDTPLDAVLSSRANLRTRFRAWWWARRHYVRDRAIKPDGVCIEMRCGSYRMSFNFYKRHINVMRRDLSQMKDGQYFSFELSNGFHRIPAEIVPELRRVVALHLEAMAR